LLYGVSTYNGSDPIYCDDDCCRAMHSSPNVFLCQFENYIFPRRAGAGRLLADRVFRQMQFFNYIGVYCIYYVPTASNKSATKLSSELSAAGQRPETNRRDNDVEVIRFIIIRIFFILFHFRGPFAATARGSKIYYI